MSREGKAGLMKLKGSISLTRQKLRLNFFRYKYQRVTLLVDGKCSDKILQTLYSQLFPHCQAQPASKAGRGVPRGSCQSKSPGCNVYVVRVRT